jgi:hypothetical protein
MLRPFPQYGTISSPWFDVGQSNYQGMQATFSRRFVKGFTFQGGYTFSKEMDNLLASTRNPFDYSLEKSRGSIDHRHVFTTSVSYDELPFGRGKSLNPGNAAARAVVSGWTVAGVFVFTSGAPLALTGTACISGGILGTCIPNYNPGFTGPVRINGGYGDGNVLGSSPTSYLNRTAFVAPAAYTVGNLPRTGVYGLNAPYNSSIDLSLRREFVIRENEG